jgi:hypothetical protein
MPGDIFAIAEKTYQMSNSSLRWIAGGSKRHLSNNTYIQMIARIGQILGLCYPKINIAY